jgi:hypothetical protein
MGCSRTAIRLTCFIVLTLCALKPVTSQTQTSRVQGNTFISPDNPKIRVTVDKSLDYVGSVPLTIDHVAAGQRYVFIHATPEKHVQQMFILQQEGFLPSSDDTYKYTITNPVKLGSLGYRHSVIMYDNDVGIREEPGKEGDVTKRFLTAHGYSLEPELIMPRFARPADSLHKTRDCFFLLRERLRVWTQTHGFPRGFHQA